MAKDEVELLEQVKEFIGEENREILKKISGKEKELFIKSPIDIDKSYIVYGNRELLKKFKAFYLTRCVKKKPRYSQYFILEYAETLSGNTKDEFGLGVDKELIFLYRHEHMQTLGNSEIWLLETILNKVAERNRDGFVTIILSEQRMPYLEKSGELEIINLSKVIVHENIQMALQKKVTVTSSETSKGSVSSNNTFFD